MDFTNKYLALKDSSLLLLICIMKVSALICDRVNSAEWIPSLSCKLSEHDRLVYRSYKIKERDR